MKAKILGITSYEKNERKNYTLHCLTEFNDYDKEHGAVGYKSNSIWTNSVDCSALVPGDYVDLYFEPGFNNTATLSGYSVLPQTKDNPFVGVTLDFKAIVDSVSAQSPKAEKQS